MGEIQKMKQAKFEAGLDDEINGFTPGASTEASRSKTKSFEIGSDGLYTTPTKTKTASKLTNTPDEFPLLLGCPLCDQMHDITGW